MNRRIPAFWQAIIVLVVAWLVMQFAFPPFLPRSLALTYLFIVTIGLVLYFSSEDRLWEEFKLPFKNTLRNDDRALLRAAYLVVVPLLLGWISYDALKPRMDAPPELRQVHPAPPGTLNAFGKTFDLATLENPVRTRVLEQLADNPDEAWAAYRDAVSAGSEIFYRNCFFCHGDRLEADGHFANGLDPLPTNFRDVGTIAQLQESYLFWRIAKGGPGLPKDGMPWKSAMPAWEEMLGERDIWNVITFLYDNVGQVPRMWDQDISRAVSAMRDNVATERQDMSIEELYQFRCAVCHGAEGMGDGPAAEFVSPRPRDFTLGLYKYKTSAVDLPPRDLDLVRTIRDGLPGTSMPGWGSILNERQIGGLITYIKGLDIAGIWAPPDAPWEDFDDDGRYKKTDFRVIEAAEPTEAQVPYSTESIEAGQPIYVENCEKCHGAMGRGNITSGTFLEDDSGYRIWPRDLTQPWTWRSSEAGSGSADSAGRDETIRNIFTRVSVGIPGTPMPAHRSAQEGVEDAIPPEGRWHVANYVYSLRTGSVPPGEQAVIQAVEVTGDLPTNADSEEWSAAPGRSYRLTPNILKEDRLFMPVNQAISVRALYNETEIAFLLEINDRTESIPGGAVTSFFASGDDRTMYPDAVAIQFPKEDAYSSAPVDKPLFRHGDPAHGTTIWYWNAGSIEPSADARAILYDASGSNQKLESRAPSGGSGPSLGAAGSWQDGRWRVVMKRLRYSEDGSGDIAFPEGQLIPISFANWDGNNGEVGSKHTFTNWYWLLLPPETNYVVVAGVPAGLALAVFLGGLLLVRIQRRKPWPGNAATAAAGAR